MFLRVLLIFYVVPILALFLTLPTHALKLRSARVKIPKQCELTTDSSVKVVKESDENYRLYFGKDTVFPLEIKITDLFGAHVKRLIKDPSLIDENLFKEDVLFKTRANPIEIFAIPKLCPRTRLLKEQQRPKLVYDTKFDVLNGKPKIHLFDPDYRTNPAQRKILKHFDSRNVLTIKRIRITYDFEDTSILDYFGPHPVTKLPHIVYEGEGGFYANFHYAVIPYDERVLKLDRQEILNLAQGKLKNIRREDLTPLLRTHSFLPGPYLSNNSIYQMCEWGDTTFQAREQEMHYNGMKVWDWDLLHKDEGGGKKEDGGKNIKNKSKLALKGRRNVAGWRQPPDNRVIMIIWEGDEEDWLIAKGAIDPYYLTDDLVGVFVIDRNKTMKPRVFKNDAGNFEMEVATEL